MKDIGSEGFGMSTSFLVLKKVQYQHVFNQGKQQSFQHYLRIWQKQG